MKIIEHEYELKLDFVSGQNNPEQLYLAMISAFKFLQESDTVLARSISKDNRVTMSLIGIKEGSLRNFVRTRTECPENDLQPQNTILEEKVTQYFVQGKKAITQGLLALNEINNENELNEIVEGVKKAAIESEIISEPFFSLPTPEKIKDLAIIAEESTRHLDANSRILYIENNENPIQLPKVLSVDKGLFEEIDKRKTVKSERVIVLKVKKPDFLGDSKWEMKHGSQRIVCKIIDENWIERFKNKEVLVFPGDSLEAKVLLVEEYNIKGDLVKTEYTILEILDVIQGKETD